MTTQDTQAPKRSRLKTILLIVVALPIAIVGWHTLNRLLSPLFAVKIRQLPDTPKKKKIFKNNRLRIGIYNIAHGRGLGSNWKGGSPKVRMKRLRKISALLKKLNLDVVVLNEVDFNASWSFRVNQAEVIARHAGFPYWLEQRNFDVMLPFFRLRFGNAILSRYPLKNPRLLSYPPHSIWEGLLVGHKKGAVCTVVLSENRSFDLLGVHLEHRKESVRVRGAKVIETFRKKLKTEFVAAGDFNSAPIGYPVVRQDKKTGLTAVSLLLQGGGLSSALSNKPSRKDLTFPSRRPNRVIDWIFVPHSWNFASYKVIRSHLSDHLPVVAEVVLPKRTKPSKK